MIERQGLAFRKKQVEEILVSQQDLLREPARVRLTFRGKPVVAAHGLLADFGTAVLKAFTYAVAAVGASQNAPLRSRGAIPGQANYRLMITGTALGSFGFELEAVCPEDLLPESSPIELAIMRTMSILQATVGTDEVLVEAVSDTHPRALGALRTFLRRVADQEATCILEFRDHVLRFANVSQVRRSEARLSTDNISDEEQVMSGRFLGMLPNRRTFEFRDSVIDRVISGRLISR